MGGDYLSAFTVGDQLLWGAAEPLRRMLRILLDAKNGAVRQAPVGAAASKPSPWPCRCKARSPWWRGPPGPPAAASQSEFGCGRRHRLRYRPIDPRAAVGDEPARNH